MIETKNAWSVSLFGIINHEYLDETFELSDNTKVPIGTYDFAQVGGFFWTPFNKMVSTMVNFTVGDFFDGNLVSLGLTPFFKISSHLEFSGFYQLNRVRFPERQQGFNSHLARLKVLYMLNTRFSVSAFIQYNSLEEIFASNIRLRYNPREGNDLYIVFNDLLNSNRDREEVPLPFSSERTIVVKYTHTLRW